METLTHQLTACGSSQRFSPYVWDRTGATPIRRLFSEFAGACVAFRTLPLWRSPCALHTSGLPTSGLCLDRWPLSVVENLLRSKGRLSVDRLLVSQERLPKHSRTHPLNNH